MSAAENDALIHASTARCSQGRRRADGRVLAAAQARGATRRQPKAQLVRAGTERVRAHRRGQHRDRARQAPRDGAGRLHRPRHARRRGARRRLEADSRRRRAGRCQALQQPGFGSVPGHGRQHLDREFVRSVAQGRRDGARDAGRRGRAALEGAGERDHRCERRRRAQASGKRHASASWSRMRRSCRCRPT